jgi:hypothetical protein
MLIQSDKGIKNTKTGDNLVRPPARTFKSSSPSFGYIDNQNSLKTVKAPNPDTAINTAPNIAPTSGVIQQTTSSERSETLRRQNDLNARQQRRLDNQQKMAEATANKKEEKVDEKPKDVDENSVEFRVNKIETEASDQVKQITAKLDEISMSMDDASNDLISSIRQIYGARIEKMKQSNTRLLGTKEQLGIRSTGLARYSPGLQAGILAEEEIAGHERIAELEGELLSAVAKASQAKSENKLKMFNEQYDRVETVFSNMQKEIQDLHETALKKDKEAREAEKAERDAEKAKFENEIKKSQAVSTAVAGHLTKYTTQAEKDAFLEKYAETIGVDVDILRGEVETAGLKTQKSKLDIQNTQSTINKRSTSPQSTKVFGTPSNRSTVNKYLSANGDASDIQKAKEDEQFFYYVLNIAEQEE